MYSESYNYLPPFKILFAQQPLFVTVTFFAVLVGGIAALVASVLLVQGIRKVRYFGITEVIVSSSSLFL
jgi:hypothetical protein